MRNVPSWQDYFFNEALHAATRSKDPNTQVGAAIVDYDNHVICTGYNGFPPGVKEDAEVWQRPLKYDRVIHAETNAIARAARKGVSINGARMYVTAFPCLECAKLIIAAGIREVHALKLIAGWNESHQKAVARFNEADVKWSIQDSGICSHPRP